jgi:hypothetical protein
MATLTCPPFVLSPHPHAPRRRVPRPLHEPCNCVAGLSSPHAPCRLAPRGCTNRVAVPLAVACTASPCLRWLMLYSYGFFFLFFSFSANSLFCSPVTTLSPPSLLTDAWSSSPSRTYHGATTDRDDNNNGHVRTMTVAAAPRGTTATTTSHAATIAIVTPHAAWPPLPRSPTTVPATPRTAR